MNLTTILQMQKDRSNGVLLTQPSIDKLIGHALMREIESERLTQALADSNLALMEQTELADQCRKQAETLEAERDQARAALEVAHARQMEPESPPASAPVAAIHEVTDAMVEAFTSFEGKTSYLRHPDVPYGGTNLGDSPEAWRLRWIKAAIKVAIDAAPQQHAQAAQPAKQYGLAAYAQANADSRVTGNAQAALSDEQSQNLELVIARLEQIAAHPIRHIDTKELAEQALPCARAILATRQPAPIDPIAELVSQQKPLDKDVEKILFDNLDNLYAYDEVALVAVPVVFDHPHEFVFEAVVQRFIRLARLYASNTKPAHNSAILKQMSEDLEALASEVAPVAAAAQGEAVPKQPVMHGDLAEQAAFREWIFKDEQGDTYVKSAWAAWQARATLAQRAVSKDSERDAASRVTVEMLQAQIDTALQIITTMEEQNKIETQLNQNGERDAAIHKALDYLLAGIPMSAQITLQSAVNAMAAQQSEKR